MSGNGHRFGLGRLAAPATLVASAALFVTALSGIASIDPAASAARNATPLPPAAREAVIDRHGLRGERHDCPWHERRDGRRRDLAF